MLTRDEPYADLGPDWLARRNDEAHARRLVAQISGSAQGDPRLAGRLTQLDKNWRTGSARPALTRACNSPIHGSVTVDDLGLDDAWSVGNPCRIGQTILISRVTSATPR